MSDNDASPGVREQDARLGCPPVIKAAPLYAILILPFTRRTGPP